MRFERGLEGEDAGRRRQTLLVKRSGEQFTGVVLAKREFRVGVDGMGHLEQRTGERIDMIDDGLVHRFHGVGFSPPVPSAHYAQKYAGAGISIPSLR